jgi:hypothetical protein
MVEITDKVKKAMKQLKGVCPEWDDMTLREKAERLIKSKELLKEIDLESIFTKQEELSKAKILARKYLFDFSIENVSDRNNLVQLIYLEILNSRIQTELEKCLDGDNVELMHKNLKEIANLKDKLGISKKKRDEQQQSSFDYLQLLKRKYRKWLEENQASRTIHCPHCANYILLAIKTDIWESLKHPFFKDKLLGNTHLIQLYKENKLSKEDVAKILGTSPDYTEWLVQHWK